MIKKIIAILIVTSIVSVCIPVSYADTADGYASGLYTEAQYDYIKTKIEQKAEPWFSAYNRMISLAEEWIDEEPSAVESWYVPGYYGDAEGHKNAREILMNDAKSAYACAVAYKFTGLSKYAEQTIKILDDWTKLTSLGYEDSGLVFSYVGNALPMSADLVKNYNGWVNKAAFDKWVKDYYLPLSNKSWSSGNSGDWNLFARAVGYAYLGDNDSLKNIIVGDEEQSGSVKYLIARIREDGVLHKELERGSNGLWYSYFALAPLTACCQVLYNNLGEDYFNWKSSGGRSVKQAVDTYFYYCNNIDEWNQLYKDYYDGNKTTSAWYPEVLASTDWPLPLFEAMAGVYNNQGLCDYVGRYRPIYGTINDGVYHHFAWFFPTLMYGSLQLGGGLPEYKNTNSIIPDMPISDFKQTEYFQQFEGNYTINNSTTFGGRDKYAILEGDAEIYYIEKATDKYIENPISINKDAIYGGNSPYSEMLNSAKTVVNLPRSYTADDGIVSVSMRVYRPKDNTFIRFYEKPVDEGYNIAEDNPCIAYISHVKHKGFFMNSDNKINAAKLPSGNDYYNYSSGRWTWLKLAFNFNNDTVTACYKDSRNDSQWLPWGIDNNVFSIWGNGVGSIVFEGKGSAQVDDVLVESERVYLTQVEGNVHGVITDNSYISSPYQWQTSAYADFSVYEIAEEGIYTGEDLVYSAPSGCHVRLAINEDKTTPVAVNSLISPLSGVYRCGGTGNTDMSIDALSQVRRDMYAFATVYNTADEVREVIFAVALYGDGNTLTDLKVKAVNVQPKSYTTISTEAFEKPNAEELRVFVLEPDTLNECMRAIYIPKW